MLFSRLVRVSGWLLVANVIGGLLGYVFQVLMGRMLGTEQYGVLIAMMAFYSVLGAALGTLLMVVSRKVSQWRVTGDAGGIFHFYAWITTRTAVIGAVLLVLYLFLVPEIQARLKSPSATPVVLLGVLLLVVAFAVINNAFLQGLQRFFWLSASNPLASLLKIACSALLVCLGYGLAGAVGGIVVATAATWAATYAALRGSLAAGRGRTSAPVRLSIRAVLPVFIANVAFAAMTQFDMVLVNYYFTGHEAGLYAAASILGKAVMYLPGGIALALFPMVAESHAREESSAHLLLQAVFLTMLLCAGAALLYFLFGEWLVTTLYGESYRSAGELLRYFGLAMIPMALILVAEHFLIAKGRVLFAYLFGVMAPLQLLLIHFFHETLQMVIAVVGSGALIVALLGFSLLWRAYRRF